MKSNEHPKKYVDNWLMNIYHIDEICSLFGEVNFKLTYEEEHYDYSLEPTVEYWLQNLDKLDSIEKTKHIQLLELSARYLKQNKDQILRDIGFGVSDQTTKWENGKCLAFSDFSTHYAWNNTEQDRINLIIDLDRSKVIGSR